MRSSVIWGRRSPRSSAAETTTTGAGADVDMIDDEVSISRLAWDVVRQSHGIEQQHHVLHVATPQVTGYSEIERRALDELVSLGLADGHAVSPALLRTMALLAAPPLELYAWLGRAGHTTLGAVAASNGGAAVLAVLDEHAVRLRPVPPDGLAQAIVQLLPAVAAGRGRSMTVPVDAYREVVESGGGRSAHSGGSILQSNRAPDQVASDCRAMQRVLGQTRLGGGQVYAGMRTAFGQHRKAPHPITYLDLKSGRWLTKQQSNGAGAVWVVLAPASPELLITELNGLLNALG